MSADDVELPSPNGGAAQFNWQPSPYSDEEIEERAKHIGELEIDNLPRDTEPPAADLISAECDALKELLLEKNRAYGNSVLEPVRIFSKASPEEQLRVRLDDKLSRLVRGKAAGEDVVQDLLGYLIMLRICRRTTL